MRCYAGNICALIANQLDLDKYRERQLVVIAYLSRESVYCSECTYSVLCGGRAAAGSCVIIAYLACKRY